MLVKVLNAIVLEVEDAEQGEEACSTLQLGMRQVMEEFPTGNFVAIDIDHFEEVSADEAKEKGWVEE